MRTMSVMTMSSETVQVGQGALSLFPGQGSQHVGMGRRVVRSSEQAARFWNQASEALGRDLGELCWNTPLSQMTETANSQVALTAVSIASFMAAMENGSVTIGEDDAYAGHSIGALSAAVASGYVDPIDAVRLSAIRGQCMASAPIGGSMLAVVVSPGVTDEHELMNLSRQLAGEFDVDVAAYNGHKQIVLSGELERLQAARRSLGGGAKMLEVSNAFHSRYMKPIALKWLRALAETKFAEGGRCYIGCTTAQPTTDPILVRRDLARGLVCPVRWLGVMLSSQEKARIQVFGPGGAIAHLARPYLNGRPLYRFEDGR